MDKSELKLKTHFFIPGQGAIEVWHEGKMVATVYGADGPGVRIITKHPYDIIRGGPESGEIVKIIEVRLNPDRTYIRS